MKKFGNLVNSELTRSIHIQDKLSNAVYEILNLDKERHNIWVVMKQQKLTLVTDHPILAGQLQAQQEMIRDKLNKQFLLQLKTSQIKIAPPKAARKAKKEKRFVITEDTAKVLAGIADLIDDEGIKKSLKNISINTNK